MLIDLIEVIISGVVIAALVADLIRSETRDPNSSDDDDA